MVLEQNSNLRCVLGNVVIDCLHFSVYEAGSICTGVLCGDFPFLLCLLEVAYGANTNYWVATPIFLCNSFYATHLILRLAGR